MEILYTSRQTSVFQPELLHYYLWLCGELEGQLLGESVLRLYINLSHCSESLEYHANQTPF